MLKQLDIAHQQLPGTMTSERFWPLLTLSRISGPTADCDPRSEGCQQVAHQEPDLWKNRLYFTVRYRKTVVSHLPNIKTIYNKDFIWKIRTLLVMENGPE